VNEGAVNPTRGQKAQESSTSFKHTSIDVTSGLLVLAVFGGFAGIADVGSDDMMAVLSPRRAPLTRLEVQEHVRVRNHSVTI